MNCSINYSKQLNATNVYFAQLSFMFNSCTNEWHIPCLISNPMCWGTEPNQEKCTTVQILTCHYILANIQRWFIYCKNGLSRLYDHHIDVARRNYFSGKQCLTGWVIVILVSQLWLTVNPAHAYQGPAQHGNKSSLLCRASLIILLRIRLLPECN